MTEWIYMNIAAVKTSTIHANQYILTDLLSEFLPQITDGSVVAISSKVVALCESRVVPIETDKEDLIRQESQLFLDSSESQYGHHFSIAHNTLVGAGGIDESNGDGYHVLWPSDPQVTANLVREWLVDRYKLTNIGVIITDSVSTPMRLGSTGTYIAHSGFAALKNYIGQPDIFGKPFAVSRSNIANGLAAAANVVMGEGTQRTPIAIMTDLPFVEFQSRSPSSEELRELTLTAENDLFEVFFRHAPWQKGGKIGGD